MKWYRNKITGQRFASKNDYYRYAIDKFNGKLKSAQEYADEHNLRMEWYEGGVYYEEVEKDPTPTPPSIEENSTEVKEHFENEDFEI